MEKKESFGKKIGFSLNSTPETLAILFTMTGPVSAMIAAKINHTKTIHD